MGRRVGVAVVLVIGLAVPARPEPIRFFVAGNGRLALKSLHTGAEASVTYRRPDGTYDREALARLRHVLRSGDGREGPLEPRFVELLGWVFDAAGGTRPLGVQSGYRSPAYNEGLRRKGAKAASASLHTEGMAADVVLERAQLAPLWERLRALECCGVGYYPHGGFVHVDVGLPRFWGEATSRVDENLSAGNARVFARTDFDRYRPGDVITVRLHAVTAPPVRVAPVVRSAASAAAFPVTSPAAGTDGCITADAATVFTVRAPDAVARGPLVFETCAPRPAKTPDAIRTNPIVVTGD